MLDVLLPAPVDALTMLEPPTEPSFLDSSTLTKYYYKIKVGKNRIFIRENYGFGSMMIYFILAENGDSSFTESSLPVGFSEAI